MSLHPNCYDSYNFRRTRRARGLRNDEVDALGAEYLRFNPQHFPEAADLSISYDRFGSARRILNYQQKEVDLGSVRAVWSRATTRPIAAAMVKEEQRWWVSEGCTRFLAELWECIDCLWLPDQPIADRDRHRVSDRPDMRRRFAQPPRLRAPSDYNKLHQLAVESHCTPRNTRGEQTRSLARIESVLLSLAICISRLIRLDSD
jgi:hypothetical protein